MTVQIKNSMQFEATLSDLYNKRISISYVPATNEDARIINSYGSIFKTPAYLINMKPQLKSDGIVLAEGASITLGKTQNVNLTFKTIGVTTESTTHVLNAGDIYNISFNYGVISSSEMNSVADNLELLKHTANENNIYTDEVLGEILCAVGRGYYAKVDLCNALVAGQYGVRSNKLTCELMTGYKANVQYLFSSPMRVNEGGMFIDAPRNINSVIDEEGDRTNEIAYMLATGMLASAMEHEIFEDFTDVPSVSAMKIFQVAGERHIPIYNITKANLSEVLPELDISQAIKNDIRSAVNSGKVVAVPQRNVQYFDWNGVGYIVLDPTTGAAGYMINGGLAGGSMTWSEALGEYLIYVAIGLALMPVFIAITTVFVYAFPVAGPIIVKVVGALLLANWAYDIGKLIGTSITTQNPDYLYEALIQIAATATLWGLSSTILKGPVAKFQQNIIVQSLQADGWTQDAAISLYQLCGGDISRISQVSTRLINLGLDNPGLTFIVQNFDFGTILIIENTFARISFGRLSSGDVDIIFGMFKTAGTPAAVNALSDSLVSITNDWGILPSQFGSLGIHGSPALIAANNALAAGITSAQMSALADFGINVADYSGYSIISWSAAQAAESAMSNVKSFGANDQMQIVRVGANAARAMANGCLFTEPSLPLGGKPDTTLAGYAIPDPKDPLPIILQNETADLFADRGYAVVLLPEDPRNAYGVESGNYPDYLIEVKAFDCYTPEVNTNPRNIWSVVKDKTVEQAERIVINLGRNTNTIDELLDQFYTWDTDLPTLKELFLVKGKELCRILIK